MNVSNIIKPDEPATKNGSSGRMSLSSLKRGVVQTPVRVLIYGTEGIGKSTFASGAPSPIFLGAESGTHQLAIDRFAEPQSWQDVLDALRILISEPHTFQTLVLDPINWMEPLCWDAVTGDTNKSIEEYGGGYGKGYKAALTKWRELVSMLETVWRKRSMNVVITAHSLVKMYNDPNGSGYDRFNIAMNEQASGLFRQWVDYVFFARHSTYEDIDAKTKKVKGKWNGARVLQTQWEPAWDAKSRSKLPAQLPLSWLAFSDALKASETDKLALLERIETDLKKLASPDAEAKVRAYIADARGDLGRITEIADALAQKLADASQ